MGSGPRHASLEVECFPAGILERAGIPPLQESLASIHFPRDDADAERFREFSSPQQRRLIFGELFALQWALALRRAGTEREEAIPLPWDREIVDEIKRRLPFDLTGAQRRVVNEILKDLGKPHPMHRLLQGDVGSGKTIVAWIAAMVAWRHGVQAAVMAPTEILAEQHYRRFLEQSAGLPVRVALLSAALPPKEREAVRKRIRDGEADIVVGTHALIQESVAFRNLALGVIDEQHRFGVLQRASLRRKGRISPHLLVMTATPIPRTLAITLYGDLDVSVIDEMPRGRIPVRTKVVTEDGRRKVFEEIRREIARGGRAYVVLPLVEESEKIALRDATRTAERLREAFPGVGVGLLHGRMKAAEKEETMGRFKGGDLQLLVSTTVVEVGVDVPEATVMVVEHAERFGLSQLHQLRGRVGRGTRPSSCFLMAGGEQGEEAAARLSVMEKTADGFRIAEEDLRIRGPGDFAGVRQSGIPDLVFADLVRDASILHLAKEIAAELHREDPRPVGARSTSGIRRFLGDSARRQRPGRTECGQGTLLHGLPRFTPGISPESACTSKIVPPAVLSAVNTNLWLVSRGCVGAVLFLQSRRFFQPPDRVGDVPAQFLQGAAVRGDEGGVTGIGHGFAHRGAPRADRPVPRAADPPDGVQGGRLAGRGVEDHHVDGDAVFCGGERGMRKDGHLGGAEESGEVSGDHPGDVVPERRSPAVELVDEDLVGAGAHDDLRPVDDLRNGDRSDGDGIVRGRRSRLSPSGSACRNPTGGRRSPTQRRPECSIRR